MSCRYARVRERRAAGNGRGFGDLRVGGGHVGPPVLGLSGGLLYLFRHDVSHCTNGHNLGGGWNAVEAAPVLLRQVELAVLRVFEGVQGALPVLVVPVAALDAGLFDNCWHGGFPRMVADGHDETAHTRRFFALGLCCRGRSLSGNSSRRQSSVLGKRRLLRVSRRTPTSLRPWRKEELRVISLTCPWAGAALLRRANRAVCRRRPVGL